MKHLELTEDEQRTLQRVNVLGALRHDGSLTWTTQQRPTAREDVMAFFDQVAAQAHEVPRIVLIDNAGIHKGPPIEKKRRHWARHGRYLYYLPPYSPELNRIEILWKHAKYFWRRFVAKNGADLLDEIQSLMGGLGSRFTINLGGYLDGFVSRPCLQHISRPEAGVD